VNLVLALDASCSNAATISADGLTDLSCCVQVQACIEVTAVPHLSGVAELVEARVHSTAETANRDVLYKVDDRGSIMQTAQVHALLDPQTSGAPTCNCRKVSQW
jgi:selenophosphate synthase